jgi:prophage regulatory protein
MVTFNKPRGQIMTVKILRRPEVEKIVGLSRSTLYAMMAENTFPKPIKLGKRAIGWSDNVIAGWIDERTSGDKSHD